MEQAWFKHYPEGVPHEIDYHQYSSLVDLLEESFKKFSTRDAYVGQVDDFCRSRFSVTDGGCLA